LYRRRRGKAQCSPVWSDAWLLKNYNSPRAVFDTDKGKINKKQQTNNR
jgi:hypothetical protein